MGILGAWYYGKDLGSIIEDTEKIIAKIKTNKYDNDDVKKLKDILAELDKAIQNEN